MPQDGERLHNVGAAAALVYEAWQLPAGSGSGAAGVEVRRLVRTVWLLLLLGRRR